MLTRSVDSDGNCAFVQTGFTNWRKAGERFHVHEKSSTHRLANEKLSLLSQKSVITMLSDKAVKEQAVACGFLRLLFRSVRLLGRMGLPFRGDDNHDGVLWQLMKENCSDKSDLDNFMRRRDNWMSNNIQNEIIEMFAHAIQRSVSESVSKASAFALIADGTTDTSGEEQFSLCIQFADANLDVKVMFLGFYNCPNTSSQMLTHVIEDVLVRIPGLGMNKLKAFCFDGANNMNGRHSGVQARLKQTCEDAISVHCANHALDLVLQEECSKITLIADCLFFVREVSTLIGESPKRKALYVSMFGEKGAVKNLLSLCPIRWCIRGSACKRMIAVYDVTLKTLSAISSDMSTRAEVRVKATALAKKGSKAETFFGLLVCEKLFSECEVVAKKLQGNGVSAVALAEMVQVLVVRISTLRSEVEFNKLVEETNVAVTKNGLGMPDTGRMKRTPSRYRHSENATPEQLADEDGIAKWRRAYYQVMDLALEEVKRRFDQDGMKVAAKREQLLLHQTSATPTACEMPPLPNGINKERLLHELQILPGLCPEKPRTTIGEFSEIFKSLHSETRQLFPEVNKLLQVCLSMPFSVATAERSFSLLRRLKTWMRATMSQKRLTHLALMNVHREILDSDLLLDDLLRDFISKTPERRCVFGSIGAKGDC